MRKVHLRRLRFAVLPAYYPVRLPPLQSAAIALKKAGWPRCDLLQVLLEPLQHLVAISLP